MKLISVKILGDNFRSLAANKLYEFNVNERKDRLSTKVFAGLNGSGKSNFLELFSEIFYYLEMYHSAGKSEIPNRALPFGFEIEYLLPKSKSSQNELDFSPDKIYTKHVRITKQPYELPEFSKREPGHNGFIRVDEQTQSLLPTKVIAYTSGQNELLSNPFYKIKYHYFKQLENRRIEEDKYIIDTNRLFFLDHSANFSIFISNMLIADERKLKYIKDLLKISDLNSFRITINLLDNNKKRVPTRKSLEDSIFKLKLCATSWVGRENQIILDFNVNAATKAAFKFHFQNAFTLFKVFYELDMLNLYLVRPQTRKLIINAHKSLNISDEMPKADPSSLIFRIEKIKINKLSGDPSKPKDIYYKGLSDGEHQFNEVIGSILMMEEDGCLFLMDEPDTHFNPMWRAKMIEVLNYVTATSFDDTGRVESVRNQEIIITTHSPFIISDSQAEDVYKFEKIDNVVHYTNPDITTYGASVGLILEIIFGRDITISDLSNNELKLLKESIKNSKDLKYVKKALLKFGESVEKFDAYSFLQYKEEEFKNQQ